MSRGEATSSGWTHDEVQELEQSSGERYEFVDGAIYAVAGSSLNHYPDLSVFCGEPLHHEGLEDLLTNPTLLFEVTSPESRQRDVVVELGEYTALHSLQGYVVVEQTRRESPCTLARLRRYSPRCR